MLVLHYIDDGDDDQHVEMRRQTDANKKTSEKVMSSGEGRQQGDCRCVSTEKEKEGGGAVRGPPLGSSRRYLLETQAALQQ